MDTKNQTKPTTVTLNLNNLNNFQSLPINPIPRVLDPAPFFKGLAVQDQDFIEVCLSDYKGKYVVLFFYPMDFTFVCPTELQAFSKRISDFEKINTVVLAASTDSEFTHLAWLNQSVTEGGLGPINFPLISDKSGKMSRDYGILIPDQGVALRALFIIDTSGILRQITVNDLPVGRCVDEVFRLLQAFQFTDKYGEVCPANWHPGDEGIKPTVGKKH